ncbi:MAG: hypothetical protein ACRDHW_21640, partial [Ktedonobacteraceae bacterium]
VLGLRQGECFVFSPGVIGFQTMIRARRSPHLAHTPGLAQLASHLRQIRPLEIVTASSRYAGVNPRDEPHTSALPTVSAQAKPRLSAELQRALEKYQPGISYRDLGRAIGCGKDKAGELLS